MKTRKMSIRIPDGPNPAPLRGKDKVSILAWAEAVRAYWRNKGYFLAKSGLCYYLQWIPVFEDDEDSLEAARKIVNENLTDDVSEDE